MTDTRLRQALQSQASSNEALGSPFTARILRLLAQNLDRGTALTDRMFDWPGDLGPGSQSVPLRLLGALHALVLSGRDPKLAACYPPNPDPGDRALWQAVAAAIDAHATFVDRFLDSPPQTNEIGRSAVLIAVLHWLTRQFALPIILSELGASAGLNLQCDRYGLRLNEAVFAPAKPILWLTPECRGAVPPVAPPSIADRRGVDVNPIDLNDPKAVLRLRSYLWADQTNRLDRMTRALVLPPVPVERADAGDWLARRLTPWPGQLHLVYNTVAWQYFPPATQVACTAALDGAGATTEAPLAHLQMENDGRPPGAALTLRLWPGPEDWRLGRADFHGRWLDWRPARVS